MEAATWTAIGLLAATSLGSLFYLGSRIDALGTRLDARIDAQGANILVHGMVESWIREYPDQWLWLHDRWRVGRKGQKALGKEV